MKAAIRDSDPVVVLEPRSLYGQREDFEPNEDAVIPFGVGEIRREGTDVTVVAMGQMVGIALEAAEKLMNVSAEVIDLRTLMPWDHDIVQSSVEKTGRLVIVEENQFSGGWGAEIVSFVCSNALRSLVAPPMRITAPDVHVPYAQVLEKRFLPSSEYVANQISAYMSTGEVPAPWWEESR